MTEEEAGEKAEAYFRSGYNCSQSVFLVFAPQLGLAADTAAKVSQAFGGGICRLRETCGTLNGMLMALSLLRGSADGSDKAAKDELYREGQLLAQQFRRDNGSIICRELLGLAPAGGTGRMLRNSTVEGDGTAPVSEARTEAYYKKRPCPELCRYAARLFQRYLDGKLSAGPEPAAAADGAAAQKTGSGETA
jgi:C_GCAxxG_C_C family probable redox protein